MSRYRGLYGTFVEPSIQAGQGNIYLENTETGKGIWEDYEEFCKDIVDMALDAESEQDFKSDLKNFYDRFLDWIADSDDGYDDYDDYDDEDYDDEDDE